MNEDQTLWDEHVHTLKRSGFLDVDEKFERAHDPCEDNDLLSNLTGYAKTSDTVAYPLGSSRRGQAYFVSVAPGGVRLFATKPDGFPGALLLDERARAALVAALKAVEEPEAGLPLVASHCSAFEVWWHNEGGTPPPLPGEDAETHVRRICEIAWVNGGYEANEALESIVKQQPCCEGGECFYPMYDGEGDYIGEQNVDPLLVIQRMVQTAQDALTQVKQRKLTLQQQWVRMSPEDRQHIIDTERSRLAVGHGPEPCDKCCCMPAGRGPG
jgi:hypothetical protein